MKALPTVAIVNSLLQHAFRDDPIDMTPVKLQKLLFLLNGWHLAIAGRPCMDEPFEAWELGPVVRSVYYRLEPLGGSRITDCLTDYDAACGSFKLYVVSDSLRQFHEILDMTWEKYGGIDVVRLSTLLRAPDSPWATAMKNDRTLIGDDVTAAYFIGFVRPDTERLVTANEARAVRPIVPEPDSLAGKEVENSHAQALDKQGRERVGSRYGIDPATYETLHRLLLHRVPAQEAKDLIQKVYARFLRDIRTEHSQVVRDPGEHILHITRCVLIDHLRRRRPDGVLFDGKSTPVESTEDVARDVEGELEIQRAFGALSSKEREVLLLSLRGYSSTEIAKRGRLSPGTVKRRLIQAQVNIGMHLTSRASAKA
jgi:RNA polymerase sigma factor (sigma-70 family)